MARSKSSITSTKHILPFDKLSPLDFERLCLWLVEREGYKRAEHLGLAGSEQGRDVIARKPTPQGEELLWPVGVVFVVSCAISATAREEVGDYCAQHGLAHDFWAQTELDEKAKRHPDVVKEFFQVTGRDGVPPEKWTQR